MAIRGWSLTLDTSQIKTNLAQLPTKVDKMVAGVVERYIGVSEGYMKSNAPWHDRTGNARQSLHAVAVHAPGTHSLILAHGMPYGIWLEVRWAGRYAIIMKSVYTNGEAMMALLDRGLARI